jgi:hypothetical protein
MTTNIRVEPLEDPVAAKLEKDCRSPVYPAASVRVFPSGCAHTSFFLQHAERFRDFEIREDDVWVVSYPKCGEHKCYVVTRKLSVKTGKSKVVHKNNFFVEKSNKAAYKN